jgi:hypothetical protein
MCTAKCDQRRRAPPTLTVLYADKFVIDVFTRQFQVGKNIENLQDIVALHWEIVSFPKEGIGAS